MIKTEFYLGNVCCDDPRMTLHKRLFSRWSIRYDNQMGFDCIDVGFRLCNLEFGRKQWVRR